MASDSGTAKAKEILKDHPSEQRENRENSSTTSRNSYTSGQKADIAPAPGSQTGVPTAQAQRINPSTAAERSTLQSSTSPANVPVNPEDHSRHSNFNSKVASRAYELYQQNGSSHGDDLYHWLQAESEVLTRIPEIQQTDSTYSVVTPLDGFTAEDISVTVEPNRALILADKQHTARQDFDQDHAEGAGFSSRHSAYFVTDWPGPVDPSTATAQIKHGNLVLTVRRAASSSNSDESKKPGSGR
ncbi:MAG: DUF2934 domain-containing protein [Candidatus Acidiferrum sp.]